MRAQSVTLRHPDKTDGAAVWELVRSAGTLDVNSPYSYILLCDLFRQTCIVAEENGKLVGFVSALIAPMRSDTLFVWQIAVDSSVRGKGLGKAMLKQLLESNAVVPIRYLEATVSPSNIASRSLFQSMARLLNCELKTVEDEGYMPSMFPAGNAHEAEPLLRIGPFQRMIVV